MRVVLITLSLMAIAESWSVSSVAQDEKSYLGPVSIKFYTNGVMAFTRSGSVDLTNGVANVAGPCAPMRQCGLSDQKRLTIAPADLAKFRSLATEIRVEGLFDTACLERQRHEAELDEQRRKTEAEERHAEWKKLHPDHKGPDPIFPISVMPPPLDPYTATFEVEGVGTVISTPDEGAYKSDAHCITSATQTLWNMATRL